MPEIPPNHFNRGGLFYPLVMNYIAQFFGFNYLALRGHTKVEFHAILKDRQQADISPDDPDVKLIESLWGPLELRCASRVETTSVDPKEMGEDLFNNAIYLIRFQTRAASSLLILAYEMAKQRGFTDNGPAWEFLRHCRHAAAHGGRFKFLGKEPKLPATWSGMSITRDLEGTSLFKDDSGLGYFWPGDPVKLLWDIEQAYPSMKV